MGTAFHPEQPRESRMNVETYILRQVTEVSGAQENKVKT
jgi:hypothetical protein